MMFLIQNSICIYRILPNWTSDAMDNPSIGYLNSWLLLVLILATASLDGGKF